MTGWIVLSLAGAEPSGEAPIPDPAVPPATSELDARDQAFRVWASDFTKRAKVGLRQWGRLDALEGPPGHFLIFDRPQSLPYGAVLTADGNLIVDYSEGVSASTGSSVELEVLAPGPVPFQRASQLVQVQAIMGGAHAKAWTLRNGDPFLVRSEGPFADLFFTDFGALVGHPYERKPGPLTHGVIPVSDERLRQTTPTWVTFGASRHTGPADAELTVRGRPVRDDIELRLTVRDDHHQPLKREAWLRADHLELWWCTNPTSTCGTLQQLAVTLPPDAPRAAWLYPEGHDRPLPAVRHDGDTVVVLLPGARDAHRRVTRGTAVFSDVDPSSPEQTLVATSQLKWADVETLGQIVEVTTPWPSAVLCTMTVEEVDFVEGRGIRCTSR